MIPVSLARALSDAGLVWTPTSGDQFVVRDRDMDDQVFVLSDMTVELRPFANGTVLAFNGTTEWALDSLDQDDVLWLPSEAQLRDLLGVRFRSLEHVDGAFTVVTTATGSSRAEGTARTTGSTAAKAYGRALLATFT